MSRTCLCLQYRSNILIHRDSAVHTTVPRSSKLSVNDSLGFTGQEFFCKPSSATSGLLQQLSVSLLSALRDFYVCSLELPPTVGLEVYIYRFPFSKGSNVRQYKPIIDFFLLFIIQVLIKSVPFVQEKPITLYCQSHIIILSIYVLGTYNLCTKYQG